MSAFDIQSTNTYEVLLPSATPSGETPSVDLTNDGNPANALNYLVAANTWTAGDLVVKLQESEDDSVFTDVPVDFVLSEFKDEVTGEITLPFASLGALTSSAIGYVGDFQFSKLVIVSFAGGTGTFTFSRQFGKLTVSPDA